MRKPANEVVVAPSNGRTLPKTINVVQDLHGEPKFSLTIDGEEFPWYITTDGVSVQINENNAPSVTITLMAEQVTVNNTM